MLPISKEVSGFLFFNRIYRFPLFNSVASVILIICLFLSQASEAFFVSAMPCAQEHVMMSKAENIEQVNLSIQNLRMQSMQMESSDNDCCQQECCCSFGLLSHAVLIDVSIEANANFKTTHPTGINTALKTRVLTQLQRPPKTHLFS